MSIKGQLSRLAHNTNSMLIGASSAEDGTQGTAWRSVLTARHRPVIAAAELNPDATHHNQSQ